MIAAPALAEIGETVLFDGSDSTDPENDALTFSWNFGDGKTSNGAYVNHVYEKAGKFKVVLTVKDVSGGQSTAEHFINITNPDEGENFSIDSTSFLTVNEVLPDPEGSDDAEWIELWNGGKEEIDLTGWKLDDDEGGSRPYKIPEGTVIGPGEFLVFKKEKTKLALNNTFDAVRLFDPAGDVIFEIAYDEVPEGASYARDDNGNWHWTTTLTPGAKNIFHFQEKIRTSKNIKTTSQKISSKSKTLKTSYLETDLTEAREHDLGDKIKVKGYVTVEPGILGSQIFYIANEEACPGIQIYMYKKDFPQLKLGDFVEVSGTLSESSGEKRIKVTEKSNIKILENKEPLTPLSIQLSEVEESLEGCLVKVVGEITEKSGSNWYLDDETGELKIYFKSSLNFTKPKVEVGDQVEAVGIVSQTKSGFSLLPRYESDLKIKTTNLDQASKVDLPEGRSPKNVLSILGVAGSILGLTLVGLGIKSGIFANWWKKIRKL